MPPHSSQFLQSLDVGCFGPLKKAYGSIIKNKARCGSNHINKFNFPNQDKETILGDVIISHQVVKYDFGRQYPGGFKRREGELDTLDRSDNDIRSVLSGFQTRNTRTRLLKLHRDQLRSLGEKYSAYIYPGLNKTGFSDRRLSTRVMTVTAQTVTASLSRGLVLQQIQNHSWVCISGLLPLEAP